MNLDLSTVSISTIALSILMRTVCLTSAAFSMYALVPSKTQILLQAKFQKSYKKD